MRRTLALWAFACLFIQPWAVQAQQWVSTAYLVDPSHRLTIEEVVLRSEAFIPAPNGFAVGYTRDAHWLRFELLPVGSDQEPSVLEIRPPFLDDVRLYSPTADGGFDETFTGDRWPLSSRQIQTFGLSLVIPPLPPEGNTFYIRLTTTSSSIMALRHWTQAGFRDARTQESAILGVYYGVLLSMLFLLAWQGQWHNSGLHRSFIGFTAAVALGAFGMNGLVAPFFGRDTPVITDHWTSISTLLIYAAMGPLYRHLFQVREGSKSYRFFQVACWAPLLGLLSIPLGVYSDVMGALGLVVMATSLYGLYLSFQPEQLRSVGGPLVAAATLLVAFSGTSTLFSVMGLLPGQLWFVYGFQVGMLAALVLLMLMLETRSRVNMQQALDDRERVIAAEAQIQAERESRQELSRFVAIFSHEVKTPLAVIQGSAESLQLIAPSADENTQKRLGRIVLAAKRINLLSEQFLRKDELEEEGFEPTRRAFDLVQCVREAVDTELEQRVELRLPTSEVWWHGDRLLISIMVSNLVGNALKYSDTDQGVQVELSPDQGQWVLRVHDNGPGIDPQQLPHIFNSYYRGQRDGTVRGSGLGLYLVQRIAHLHGARVQAHSTLGQGSVFSVHFPPAQD